MVGINGSIEVYGYSAMTKYVLIRRDSSYSCDWWNTHRYRFVLLVDLSVVSRTVWCKKKALPVIRIFFLPNSVGHPLFSGDFRPST